MRSAMMPITTSISVSVKPTRARPWEAWDGVRTAGVSGMVSILAREAPSTESGALFRIFTAAPASEPQECAESILDSLVFARLGGQGARSEGAESCRYAS